MCASSASCSSNRSRSCPITFESCRPSGWSSGGAAPSTDASPTTCSTSAAAANSSRKAAARSTPACTSRGTPRHPPGEPHAGDGSGVVPVYGKQRPLTDRRGAGRATTAGAIEAVSAGSHPKPLHPNTVRVMRQRRIDPSGRRSKHLSEFARQRPDYVISPLRPRSRGMPRVSRPPEPDPLEHPRPGARRRERRGDVPRLRAHSRRTLRPDPLPARADRARPVNAGGEHVMRHDDLVERPLHGRRRRPRDRLLHHAVRLRASATTPHRRSPRSFAASCGCSPPGRPMPDGRNQARVAGTASTSSSTTSPPRSSGRSPAFSSATTS